MTCNSLKEDINSSLSNSPLWSLSSTEGFAKASWVAEHFNEFKGALLALSASCSWDSALQVCGSQRCLCVSNLGIRANRLWSEVTVSLTFERLADVSNTFCKLFVIDIPVSVCRSRNITCATSLSVNVESPLDSPISVLIHLKVNKPFCLVGSIQSEDRLMAVQTSLVVPS